MQRVTAFWRSGWIGKVVLSLGTFVIACCVLGALVPRTPSTASTPDTAPPTAQPTSAPTEQSVPTAAPTAVPTEAPEPTAEPALSERQIYAAAVAPHLQSIADGMQRLGEQFSKPDPGNNMWILRTAAATVMVELGHTELTKVTPPADLEGLHAQLLDATGDCDSAMKQVRTGLDEADADVLLQAAQLMEQCNRKINELQPEVERAFR